MRYSSKWSYELGHGTNLSRKLSYRFISIIFQMGGGGVPDVMHLLRWLYSIAQVYLMTCPALSAAPHMAMLRGVSVSMCWLNLSLTLGLPNEA